MPVPGGTSASLRGVSAVNAKIVWASGTGGTYLRTTDGGVSWHAAVARGAEQLDFRGVHAVDEQIAYLLSSGPGGKSRIYKTRDSGSHWTLQFTNPDPRGFFDAVAFWDSQHGIVIGDPVEGKFVVLKTVDGGEHWTPQPGPAALSDEGAFAASNSCLFVMGERQVWFATGGLGAARVFRSEDAGRTWTVTATPIRNDGSSAGIFSLAFSDATHGIAVGGDYTKAADSVHNIAATSDGGRTWREPDGVRPTGFRSVAAYIPERRLWIAAGPSGSDVSADGGNSWKPFDTAAYNAIAFTGLAGWAVGPKGAVARYEATPARRAP